VKLRPAGGGRAEIKLKRLQIAERLYRVTGAGIYRDSLLSGLPTPLKHPVLNAQVLGQDTVIVTPYRGRLFWFWGDTDRAGYPLGNFGASGATSEWPGRGGLDPRAGIDLTYVTNREGFSRPMCPDSEFGGGLKWIEGVWALRDGGGQEQLLARVAAGAGLSTTREWHLAQFDDAKAAFVSITRWAIHDTHDSAHPFHASDGTAEYVYLYPNYRVRATLAAARELQAYEAFTCVAGDGRVRGKDAALDRDASGQIRYAWKAGADRLHPGRLRELVGADKLKPSESWLQLLDLESGAPVEAGRGSVFWNEYLRRWLMLISGAPGEIWFSQADRPEGPWVYAQRVATHGRYNFYNPTQHPFFDEAGGRGIFFEGTYTASFSAAPAKTPRYEYNQLMYHLALDDARLATPVPVYRLRTESGPRRWLLREGVEAEGAWPRVEAIAFYAVSPSSPAAGLVPVFGGDGGARLVSKAPTGSSRPLFLAHPAGNDAMPVHTVPLADVLPELTAAPACRVWKNPATLLLADAPVRARPSP
jgi:hypothetical protein